MPPNSILSRLYGLLSHHEPASPERWTPPYSRPSPDSRLDEINAEEEESQRTEESIGKRSLTASGHGAASNKHQPRTRSMELDLFFSDQDGRILRADTRSASIDALGPATAPLGGHNRGLSTSFGDEGPLSLETFIKILPVILQKCNTRNMKKCEPVKRLLKRLEMKREDWAQFAFWDADKLYTRNLVSTDGESYTLLLLCWNPGKESPIHDHPCEGCWVKSLQGEVKETLYEMDPVQGLVPFQENRFHPGELSYIEDSMGFHKIGNPLSIGAVTLHLYIPPPKSCRIWLGARTKQDDSMTVPVCYFSAYGRRVESEVAGGSVMAPVPARPAAVPGAGAVVGSPPNTSICMELHQEKKV